jgi:alkylation response protein AidB-like acyl-CoA dehydrogenase
MNNSGHAKSIEEYLQAHLGAADQYTPYSENILHEFLELGPLHYFIPLSIGGRFEGSKSYLRIVETTSYYSVPLGLTLGITGTLFLLPILKYADPILQNKLISEFLHGPALGGIMITEPTGGTDIFGLQTSVSSGQGTMALRGTKCWGGLTGKAEHWLVAARNIQGDRLTRNLKVLYVPLSSPGVAVNTYFDTLGLQPITYGETQFSDVAVPDAHNLTPRGTSALRVLYDTLFRSRMGIPAIASGLCKRLADEVATRASGRVVFGQPIAKFDQVQFRLSTIRSLSQINHCLWRFTADWMDQHDDVSGDYILVNAIKVVSSESMAEASDSAMQIFASAGYKRNHLVGRAYVDSRPFQIFEGSNDVLHDNTFEVVAGRHGSVNPDTISLEVQKFGLRIPDDLPDGTLSALDIKGECSQRQKVHYGKIIEWIVVIGILEHISAQEVMSVDDARRVANRHLAARIAELPYLQ